MKNIFVLTSVLILILVAMVAIAKNPDPLDEVETPKLPIYDPWEPLNRKVFSFNDFTYEYFFFPISDSYGKIVPRPVRTGVRNFFHNLGMPVRVVGCLAQLKGKEALIHLASFPINTAFGLLGTIDLVKEDDQLDNEDLSQGLANWKFPSGPYIVWPIIGPSNIRNSLGIIGDSFLTAQSYLGSPDSYYLLAGEKENELSLENKYRSIKNGAIDPYSAIRDAYFGNFDEKLKK